MSSRPSTSTRGKSPDEDAEGDGFVAISEAPPSPPETVVLDARVVTGRGGGPEKTILNSPRYLTPRGYRMICAYLHTPGDPGFDSIRWRADQLGAPLIPIPDRGALDPTVIVRLLAVCRRERVAIWHGHDYKSNLLGLLLRPLWRMRLVTTVHGWVQQTPRTPLYYGIDRLCLPHYERVICVSEDLYRQSLEAGVREDRCVLLENGVDSEQYFRRQALTKAKESLGIPPDRLVIGAAGRLSEEKGFDVLIRALGVLLTRGHDATLMILGEGDRRAELDALVQTLGLGERVRLLGHRADTVELYEAMDIFALSSRREGLPNVVLEALSMGLPVLATRVAGLPSLINPGVNGLLVEPDSIADLAAGLAELLEDPALRERLGREGRRTVEADYSFRDRMLKIHDLYERLIRQRGPEIERNDNGHNRHW